MQLNVVRISFILLSQELPKDLSEFINWQLLDKKKNES